MNDLVTSLRARLDEDEHLDWHVFDCSGMPRDDGPCCDADARLPREVRAKRAILERHRPIERRPGWPATCAFDNHRWPCDDVVSLAAIYDAP